MQFELWNSEPLAGGGGQGGPGGQEVEGARCQEEHQRGGRGGGEEGKVEAGCSQDLAKWSEEQMLTPVLKKIELDLN